MQKPLPTPFQIFHNHFVNSIEVEQALILLEHHIDSSWKQVMRKPGREGSATIRRAPMDYSFDTEIDTRMNKRMLTKSLFHLNVRDAGPFSVAY